MLLSGKPKIYMKVAESGNHRQLAFYADCGTPIFSLHLLAISARSLS